MTNSLINTQITILTYLVFGFVLYKVKMIDDQSQLFISNLTINVLLPASVFVSFLNSLTFDLLKNLLIILILAAILETIILKKNEDKSVDTLLLLRIGNKTPMEGVTETKIGAERKGWTI